MLFKGLPDLVKTWASIGNDYNTSIYTGFFPHGYIDFHNCHDHQLLKMIEESESIDHSKRMKGFLFLHTGELYKLSSKYSVYEAKALIQRTDPQDITASYKTGMELLSTDEISLSDLGDVTLGVHLQNGLMSILLTKDDTFVFSISSSANFSLIPHSLIDYKLFIRFMIFGVVLCTDDELKQLSNYIPFAMPRTLWSDKDKRDLLCDAFDL